MTRTSAVRDRGKRLVAARPQAKRGASGQAGDHDGRRGVEKMRQILDGARHIFLADGFDGASMNDIALAAGVSKGTLYVYFPSKESLFEALVRQDRSLQAEQLLQLVPSDDDETPLATVLERIGLGLMTQMCAAEHLARIRMVIGAAAKYPKIGQAFHAAGPKAGAVKLGAWLERQADAGRLAALDAELAADQFIQLCQADYYKEALFGVAEPGDERALRRAVEAAVDMFLRAYQKQ
jgi:AcrR family transcriptional regulator